MGHTEDAALVGQGANTGSSQSPSTVIPPPLAFVTAGTAMCPVQTKDAFWVAFLAEALSSSLCTPASCQGRVLERAAKKSPSTQGQGRMEKDSCAAELLEGDLALQSLPPALLPCQNRGGPGTWRCSIRLNFKLGAMICLVIKLSGPNCSVTPNTSA